MHQDGHAPRQDAVGFDGLHAALGMHPIPGERFAGHRMQPVQTGIHPQAGLVGMRYRRGDPRLGDTFHRRAQPLAEFINPGQHRGS